MEQNERMLVKEKWKEKKKKKRAEEGSDEDRMHKQAAEAGRLSEGEGYTVR